MTSPTRSACSLSLFQPPPSLSHTPLLPLSHSVTHRSRGLVVQAFTIAADPHAGALLEAATGRPVGPPVNTWLRGWAAVEASVWAGAAGADVCLVDGGGGALDGATAGPRGGGGPGDAVRPIAPTRSLPAAWRREAAAAVAATAAAAAAASVAASRASTPGSFGSADSSMVDDASSSDPSPAKSTPGGRRRSKSRGVVGGGTLTPPPQPPPPPTAAADDASADGSPAQLAAWLHAPLLLVVDAVTGRGSSSATAALVKGCAGLLADAWADGPSPPPFLAGILLARVPTPHAGKWLAGELAGARVGAPVLGALPDDPAAAPGRDAPHDAQPATAGSPAAVALAARAAAAGALTAMHADLGAILDAARKAAVPPPKKQEAALVGVEPDAPVPTPPLLKVALASDAAFWEGRPGNASALAAAGCTVLPWSPLADPGLPPGISAVLIGGAGAPGRHAAGLAANARARAALAAFAAAGGAVWASGEGAAYLGQSLELSSGGPAAPMAGIFAFRARCRGGGGGKRAAKGFAASTAPAEVVTTGSGSAPWWPAGLAARGAATRRLEVLVESSVGADLAGPATPLGPAAAAGASAGARGGSWAAGSDEDEGEEEEGGSDAGSDAPPPAFSWSHAFTARRAAPGAAGGVPEGYVRGLALATTVSLDLPSAAPGFLGGWLAAVRARVDPAAAGAAAAAASASADMGAASSSMHAHHAAAWAATSQRVVGRQAAAAAAAVAGWSPPGRLGTAHPPPFLSPVGLVMPRCHSAIASPSPDRPSFDAGGAWSAGAAAAAAGAAGGARPLSARHHSHAHHAHHPPAFGALGAHLPPSASTPNLLISAGRYPSSEAGSGDGVGAPRQHLGGGHARTASSGSLAGYGNVAPLAASGPVPGCPCLACASAAGGGTADAAWPLPAEGGAKPPPPAVAVAGGGGGASGSGGGPSSSPVTTLARAPSASSGGGGHGSGGGRAGGRAHPPPPRPPSFHFPSPADLAASAAPQPPHAIPPAPSSPAALQNVAAWRTAGDGIACLSPLAAECVAGLGLGARACGVVAGGGAPAGARPPSPPPRRHHRAPTPPPPLPDPPIAARPALPGAPATVDAAWLASERPGLVICAGEGSGAGEVAAALAQMDPAGPGVPSAAAAAAVSAAGLAAHGARVLALAPRSLADVGDALLAVAAAAGVPPSAAGAAVAAFRARLRAAARAAAAQPRRPRVSVLVSLSPAVTVGGGWVPELIALAGGVDVLGGVVGPGDAPASTAGGGGTARPPTRPPLLPGASPPPPLPSIWEDVRRAAPDVLVIAAGGRGGPAGTSGPLTLPPGLEAAAALPGWWGLPAVRAGRVFLVDRALLARPGPRLADGLDILVALLHAPVAGAATAGGAAGSAASARPLPSPARHGAGLSPRRSLSPAPSFLSRLATPGPAGRGSAHAPPVPLPPPGRVLRLILSGGQRCRPCLLGDYFRPWPPASASGAASGGGGVGGGTRPPSPRW